MNLLYVSNRLYFGSKLTCMMNRISKICRYTFVLSIFFCYSGQKEMNYNMNRGVASYTLSRHGVHIGRLKKKNVLLILTVYM
jgi:hypothetical protein